ncbi:MAG: UpxY family transcription antiterminator [Bacteroidales bacterium]|jgi:transcription antitermination factor NusG|nr:UpxY family transcription antiterminator [Bacteroidales bacterium]
MNDKCLYDEVLWYALRAYKAEKKMEKILIEKGYDYFIAKKYKNTIYKGKKKRILTLAIPSLIFVHSSANKINELKLISSGSLQYMTFPCGKVNKRIVIRDDEMENFISVATKYEKEELSYVNPNEIPLEKGQKVRIIGGEFDGLVGTLLKIKGRRNKRLVVSLNQINFAIAIELKVDKIEVIE